MTPMSKAKIGLQVINESSNKDAAAKVGHDIKLVSEIRRTLRIKAYRAFAPSELAIAVTAYAAANPNKSLTAFQVGANDGKTGDPVYKLILKYFSKAILVEPQDRLIPYLTESYRVFKGTPIILNVAIGDDELVLHVPDREISDLYLKIMGRDISAIISSNRDYVVKLVSKRTKIPAEIVDARTEAVRVKSSTIESLAKAHCPEGIDLLQIDCEGYDWKVLETVGSVRPGIINFESDKLPPGHWEAFEKWSKDNGYFVIRGVPDTLAIRGA